MTLNVMGEEDFRLRLRPRIVEGDLAQYKDEFNEWLNNQYSLAGTGYYLAKPRWHGDSSPRTVTPRYYA